MTTHLALLAGVIDCPDAEQRVTLYLEVGMGRTTACSASARGRRPAPAGCADRFAHFSSWAMLSQWLATVSIVQARLQRSGQVDLDFR